MKAVLNKDVANLGHRGAIVSVKPGYFRNFLLPRGLADPATEGRLDLEKNRNEKRVMKKEQVIANAKDVLEKLKGLKLSIKAKANEKGVLYGALTEADIVEAIEKKAKLKLERELIKMQHIKELGTFDVLVHLSEGLEEKVKVTVKNA